MLQIHVLFFTVLTVKIHIGRIFEIYLHYILGAATDHNLYTHYAERNWVGELFNLHSAVKYETSFVTICYGSSTHHSKYASDF